MKVQERIIKRDGKEYRQLSVNIPSALGSALDIVKDTDIEFKIASKAKPHDLEVTING